MAELREKAVAVHHTSAATRATLRRSATHVHRHTRLSAWVATLPAHASIIAVGHPLRERRVSTVGSFRCERHLQAAVRQCFERCGDRNATAFAPDHAGAAILRHDRQALIRHCPSRGRPRSIETLLQRRLRNSRNRLVDNAGPQRHHGSNGRQPTQFEIHSLTPVGAVVPAHSGHVCKAKNVESSIAPLRSDSTACRQSRFPFVKPERAVEGR